MKKKAPGSGEGKKKAPKPGNQAETNGGSKKDTAPSGGSSSILYIVAAAVSVLAVIAAVLLFPQKPADASPPPLAPSPPDATAAASVPSTGEAGNSANDSLRWKPKTLTVVLPCAGEGMFAKKTIESVAASVPGGIGGAILSDIVVVDDGSTPPLGKEFLTEEFRAKYPITLIRHEKAIGLMGAKSAGAGSAQGDVIVFFDCHVAPQGKWYQEFLKSIAVNYRRIVVPVITDLDIDTWTERTRSMSFAKCYLTWDADFKWVQSETPHMPILSGGLLGISRRWWNETGGYDDGMRGWGGENIDQSLRTWLCGGEIVSLPKAYVAHMWRQPHDSRTNPNYEISPMHAIKNKARAVLGWFDEYIEKAGEFPSLNWIGIGSKKLETNFGNQPKPDFNADVSNLHEVRDRLQCKPFAWFLWRFRHIYEDGGMLPPETFQLQEMSSGYCLTFLGTAGVAQQGKAHAALLPCNVPLPGGAHPNAQRWHARNKNPKTGKCCSAIGSWNTDQCIVQLQDGLLVTTVCDVSGMQVPAWEITKGTTKPTVTADAAAYAPSLAAGQIVFAGKCLVVDPKAEKITIGRDLHSPVLKFAKCKKEGAKPRWQIVAPEKPSETVLYEKALRERPELFK